MRKPHGLYTIYELFLGVLKIGLPVAGLFSKKIRVFLNGRKNVWAELEHAKLNSPIWIHVASLGEFEQIRPLLALLNKNHPDQELLLTFFSPSGYAVQKNTPLVKKVTYLPLDGRKNAKRFVAIVQPKMVLLVKNEFWPSYIKVLHEKGIKLFSISSKFSKRQYFFQPYGKFGRAVLRKITHFYVQNEEAKLLLSKFHFNNVSICGDTRFDRVHQLNTAPKSYPELEHQLKNANCIVLGSVWENDLPLFENWINAQKGKWKTLLAPHQIDNGTLQKIEARFSGKLVRWSNFQKHPQDFDVLLIDSIGDLKHLYRFAHITYVGGGMKPKALHNILEAAVHAKPVLIGKYYHHFPEATALIQAGGCWSLASSEACADFFNTHNFSTFEKMGAINSTYIAHQQGATETIYKGIVDSL